MNPKVLERMVNLIESQMKPIDGHVDAASMPKPQAVSRRSSASLTMFRPIFGMGYFPNPVHL